VGKEESTCPSRDALRKEEGISDILLLGEEIAWSRGERDRPGEGLDLPIRCCEGTHSKGKEKMAQFYEKY